MIEAGGKRYEGTREQVGTSSTTDSCYIALSVDHERGVMRMVLLSDWYTFRPAVTHRTIGLDDAEELMKKSDRRADRAASKLRAMRKTDDDDDDAQGSAARNAAKTEELLDDDFDDGAGPDWAADEMQHEDGNDGMDMGDEILFESDEDDGLGDDDELAFNERQQAKQQQSEVDGPPAS